MGIEANLTDKFKELLLDTNKNYSQHSHRVGHHHESACEIFKPGFVRVSMSFCSSRSDMEFVIEAVEFVARHGYMLLPYYKCDVVTGTYYAKSVSLEACWLVGDKFQKCQNFQVVDHSNKLSSVAFNANGLDFQNKNPSLDSDTTPSHFECLQNAENIANGVRDVSVSFCSKQITSRMSFSISIADVQRVFHHWRRVSLRIYRKAEMVCASERSVGIATRGRKHFTKKPTIRCGWLQFIGHWRSNAEFCAWPDPLKIASKIFYAAFDINLRLFYLLFIFFLFFK